MMDSFLSTARIISFSSSTSLEPVSAHKHGAIENNKIRKNNNFLIIIHLRKINTDYRNNWNPKKTNCAAENEDNEIYRKA